MTNYIATDGSVCIGPFETKERVAIALIGAVTNALESDADPTKWHIEKLAKTDVPDLIPDAKAAEKYLTVGTEEDDKTFEGIDRQRDAFEELTMINKAWNRADNWEPDWKDSGQEKCYPQIFGPDLSSIDTGSTNCHATSPFVFRTSERAEQFMTRFKPLLERFYGLESDAGGGE